MEAVVVMAVFFPFVSSVRYLSPLASWNTSRKCTWQVVGPMCSIPMVLRSCALPQKSLQLLNYNDTDFGKADTEKFCISQLVSVQISENMSHDDPKGYSQDVMWMYIVIIMWSVDADHYYGVTIRHQCVLYYKEKHNKQIFRQIQTSVALIKILEFGLKYNFGGTLLLLTVQMLIIKDKQDLSTEKNNFLYYYFLYYLKNQ